MSVLTAAAPAPQKPAGVRGVIRRRPILSFFVLALSASWIAWIPYILSQNGLGIWGFEFPGGPGGGQLLGMLPGAYLGPIGAALVVTAIADGRAGLRAWAGRLWRWKVGWRWYVTILLGVPAAMVLSSFVFSGGDVQMPSTIVLVALVPGLIMQMLTTGLAEEPGWRDFALPRMQRLLGAPRAAVVIGVVWGVWHLPLYLTQWGEWPTATWYRPIEFVLFCITFNLVMTWVFNRTGQSLPMAMLLHVSVNNSTGVLSEMFPRLDTGLFQHALLLGATVAAIVTMVGTRGRLGYHPEVGRDEVTYPREAARIA
ncbi:CPBP family intramembrane glutamic endopeptidase [Cellulomonas fengjieae]|uniref:CPBP family intramembrane metalloprotease n=1 Tax=Cellulomonas fengjieae TaxID=2819978 RepID=A0ABS3SKM8_9CELL|nr:CPBP family intramembrane glutamic endopeptidase [Cellulomonas fengjieae]MBO3086304.1 CPBP family intramembrane metalloprotease [Cellulomonas fengjieae]MBO3102293.1 CPBP family intramembrane metalloprotease [Cellulomonas fengjieae]QVI65657.1 CPBP family intramembrane metalloprotease [Cellulomonas fengjieae]